jgi:hypothetical protein
MAVDIVIYRARAGLFGRRKDNSECVGKAGITNMWFLGLIIATLLIVGGVELNPGPEMEEKVLEILTVQRGNAKAVSKWMERNKASTLCMKIDKLNETMMKM